MRKLIVAFAFVTVSISYGFGQSQQKTDSLLEVLKTVKYDSSKVKILNALSGNLLKSDPDKSFLYAQQALELAQKINSKVDIVKSYQHIGGYYYYQGDAKLSLEYIKKTIPIIEELKDRTMLGAIYSNLGTLASLNADFPSAVDYMNKALKIAEENKDSARIALILSNQGIIYSEISDFTTALDYFFKSLHVYDALNMKAEMANDYYNISNIYRQSHSDDEKMIAYCELSLNTARKANDRIQTALSLQQFGEIYQDKKDYKKALDYFHQSLEISQSLGDNLNIAHCYRSLGFIYGEQGDYEKAEAILNKSYQLFEQIGYKVGESLVDGYLGELYMKKKDFQTAISYFVKSVEMQGASGNKSNISHNLKNLSDCYAQLGDYKTAYTYMQRHQMLEDSIVGEAAVKKTIEMEARYNISNKEKEIALLTKDKKIQDLQLRRQIILKNAFIAGLILMLVLFFFVYRHYRTRQLLKLQTIRNKIASDLHDDVGSTLSSIAIFSEMARQQSHEVAPMLDQISDNSRKMLESMADIVWTINPENDNFEKIILRMRSFAFELLGSKKIDFAFDADESVNDLKLSMDVRKNLFLIFKEATNNLVKYADANRASFSITFSKNNLALLIRDNGKGFNIDQDTQGNGLKNMRKRALEIGAKFLIESEPGNGTTIQILLKTA